MARLGAQSGGFHFQSLQISVDAAEQLGLAASRCLFARLTANFQSLFAVSGACIGGGKGVRHTSDGYVHTTTAYRGRGSLVRGPVMAVQCGWSFTIGTGARHPS
jgi:hypothetical protein